MRTHAVFSVLRFGSGAFVAGLIAGFALIAHHFIVTPAALCSATFADGGVFDAWPWAMPLLVFEGAAILCAAMALVYLNGRNA